MLNFGIIGAGAIARVHIEALVSLYPLCKVSAVCDNLEGKAKTLIDEFSLDAKAFTSFDEMLDSEHLDCVCICLPPVLHCDCACKALDHKIHVIVEKPMALSVELCDRMIESAKKNNCRLAVICQNRFKTAHMRLKRIVESGALGKIYQATVNSLWYRGENYYDLWWRGTWDVEGGGCLLSHGVHHLDLLLWILGKPKSLTANICNLAHNNSQCEDLVTAILHYENGMQVNLMVSLLNHGEEQEIVLQTKKAKLAIPFALACNKAMENGFPEDNPDTYKEILSLYESLPECKEEGHKAQLLHFINAVEGREELITDGFAGRDVIELIMAIYKSGVLHKEVFLPLDANDDFYKFESRVKIMPHFHEKTHSVKYFKTSKITLGRDVGK